MTFGDRLAQFINVIQRRQLGGAINIDSLFRRCFYFINHGRRSGDQIQIVFAFQTLLNDLHVQQAEEAAAEAKAQRRGAFRFIKQ
ncbi:Uncharacterised protein [Salmonella enterica subsp. enterica serovar Bovismorbificans]|uniref:Uncharacterized protein n=1 Tax=Salmonella enterica subsp. enterica serovar Bovismorbificans TaxID=58097 RepID=A0A655EG30_SALET|nr:Uncharacterised protein [Salmonella enterica subsp. enterica serovar Bovismorbificans]